MKNKSELVYGQHGMLQVVLQRRGHVVTDAFYQHTAKPNLVGLVANAKITEVTSARTFATLPNGAQGMLESKHKLKTGALVQVRVSAYVQPPKAWPLKLADGMAAMPAPTLLQRVSTLFAPVPVQEDQETIADWLTRINSTMALADGASLLVECTNALTTIDLNSGRLKNTAQQIAQFGPAVAQALRHYQLGGAIVVDAAFLPPAARKGLADKIKKHLADDPLPAKIISVTKMGLIEIIRPRLGPSFLDVEESNVNRNY